MAIALVLSSTPFLSFPTQPIINRRRPTYLQQQQQYPSPSSSSNDVDDELLVELEQTRGEDGALLPVHERLTRYHAAREVRLKMLRAQREYEEMLGLDFQPHLVSSAKARERASAAARQRARSLSPGRSGCSSSSPGRSSSVGPRSQRVLAGSATFGALPTVADLSVFDRLALEGRERVAKRRQQGKGYDDPECTFRPHLYTAGTTVQPPPSPSVADSSSARMDDDCISVASSSLG